MVAKIADTHGPSDDFWWKHCNQTDAHPFEPQINTTARQKKCIVFKKKCNFAPIKNKTLKQYNKL